MKKFIKILLIVIVAIAAIVVILSFIGPKKYELVRSTLIQADRATVWEQVSKWENFGNWSPWESRDTAMTKTFSGNPGEVGSKYTWKSKTQGNGSQTILESVSNEHRVADLVFEDWDMHSNTSMDLKDSAGGTFVTWKMYGDNNFMGRVMGVFMNMEKMVGPDYEAGLAKLKTVCEAAPKKEMEAPMPMEGDSNVRE